jgi:hypothetical protein
MRIVAAKRLKMTGLLLPYAALHQNEARPKAANDTEAEARRCESDSPLE